jgi:RecB family endonuclease NucS
MPIEVGVWRLGNNLQRIAVSALDYESRLEEVLAHDLSVLSSQLMLVGRQVLTSYGKFIDLLATDPDGNLVVVELKRNRTPREVVAQLIDYASWVQLLSSKERGILGEGSLRHPTYRVSSNEPIYNREVN